MGRAKDDSPPPPWLVRELVRLGVPEEKARSYGRRQAFAVARSMADRAKRKAADDPKPPPGEGT